MKPSLNPLLNRPLKVLHVGVGNRGSWPLRVCGGESGFVSAGLVDVDTEALQSAKALTGLADEHCFASLEQALQALGSQLDCAIVCSPTRFHVPQAERCLEAGLGVLVEKGMAPDWQSARHLAALVTKHSVANSTHQPVKACVAQNYRYNALERTIQAALTDPNHSAHPGRAHQVTYSHHRVRPEPRSLDYPFASVWDMSCHHLDNLSLWFGPLQRATAFAWRAIFSAYEHASNTSAHLEYANEVVVQYLHTHDAARGSQLLEVHGERGALTFSESAEGKELRFSERPREQFGVRESSTVEWLPAEGERGLLRDFRDYLLGGPEPGISVANNLETMAACEMLVRSIQERRSCSRSELLG